MIGLDTNVLVRYLMGDEPGQFARAADLIERRIHRGNPGFVSVVAVVEVVWVLERAYRISDHGIATAIERLLQSEAIVVESEQEVFTAMIALKEGFGSFADALIVALGDKAGCSHTFTFDRRAARLPGFRLL